MTKSQLRITHKAMRKDLSLEQIQDFSLQIANQTLQLPLWNHTYFHIFLPIAKNKEVDTSYLLHVLQGKDKSILVSKSDFKTSTLTHFLLTDATKLQENSFGIPEPTEGISVQTETIEVVFVPLLACDQYGNRVGYGKGFYDIFLTKCRPKCLFVGLSFFEPVTQISNLTARDIPLDYCVTPKKVYHFKENF